MTNTSLVPKLFVGRYDLTESALKPRYDFVDQADTIDSMVCDHTEAALPPSQPEEEARGRKYDYAEDALPVEDANSSLRNEYVNRMNERPHLMIQPPPPPPVAEEHDKQDLQVSMVIAAAEQLRAAAALRRREQLEHEAQIAQLIVDRQHAEDALHVAHAAALQRYQSQLDLANAELAATRRALVYATTNGSTISPYKATTPSSKSEHATALPFSYQTTPSFTTPKYSSGRPYPASYY